MNQQGNPAMTSVDEVMRVCRAAVGRAQEDSRRLGVPNVYSFRGHIYYELPNGELSKERPVSSSAPASQQEPLAGMS